MSLQFSDTTNYKGIVQQGELEIGANIADISGNTTKLKLFTASVNLAYDDYVRLAIQASGAWQWDDSNQTDYPIATANIVSGQRDYSLTTDGTSNLILDIYKVAILTSATGTLYEELTAFDEMSDYDNDIVTGSTVGGIPDRYGKLANGIFLDVRPNYSATSGLKIFFNREPSYFAYTDTTKKPGIPGIHHRYLVLRAAEDYARRNSLANYMVIRAERVQMEQDIKDYFSVREKDVPDQLTIKPITFI